MSGKTFFNDHNQIIIKHNLKFVLLTETRLDQDISSAVLIESTLPNFSFMSEVTGHYRHTDSACDGSPYTIRGTLWT